MRSQVYLKHLSYSQDVPTARRDRHHHPRSRLAHRHHHMGETAVARPPLPFLFCIYCMYPFSFSPLVRGPPTPPHDALNGHCSLFVR